MISSRIARTYDRCGPGKEPIYHFKVINLTPWAVTNVDAELSLVTPANVPNGIMLARRPIPLAVGHVMELGALRPGDNSASCSWLCTCAEDLDRIWADDTHAYLELRLSATHPVSGHSRVFKQEFRTRRNTIISGDFEAGRQTDIR